MKKITLILVALGLSGSTLMAQSKAEDILTRYRFGIFGGIGFSNLKPTSSTDGTDYKYNVLKNGGRAAFEVGLNMEKGINKRYAFYSGLGLNWLGGKILSTAASLTGADSANYAIVADMKYKLQYMQIPLGLKLKATNIDRFQIYTQLGLDAGILIGRKADLVIDGVTFDNQKLPIKSMNPLSIGYQIGVGTEFKVTDNNSAFAGIMYHNGFIDHTIPSARSATDKKFNDGNVRGNSFTLRAGYYF
jgi:opacity protein-like surface antigen